MSLKLQTIKHQTITNPQTSTTNGLVWNISHLGGLTNGPNGFLFSLSKKKKKKKKKEKEEEERNRITKKLKKTPKLNIFWVLLMSVFKAFVNGPF